MWGVGVALLVRVDLCQGPQGFGANVGMCDGFAVGEAERLDAGWVVVDHHLCVLVVRE